MIMTASTDQPLLSIGDVAAATGIAPDTIRVWERRYGKPEPVRLPSGHRRYTGDQIRWLRRIAEALARGHRPGKVVRAAEEELDAILGPLPTEKSVEEEVEGMMQMVRAFNSASLNSTLREAWNEMEPGPFLDERVAPLLVAVGEAWRDGDLNVRHEHFLSEVLEDLLRSLRLGCPASRDSGLVLFATLPEEEHGLGIQMAALMCAVHRVRTHIIGIETPIEEMIAAVSETKANALALTVSLSSGGVDNDRRLAELRGLAPDNVRIVVGGQGARGIRRGTRGVDYVSDLAEFEDWIRKHVA